MKKIPEAVQADWPCRRLVLEGIATVTEVETTMSIDDVADWVECSDFWAEIHPQGEPS